MGYVGTRSSEQEKSCLELALGIVMLCKKRAILVRRGDGLRVAAGSGG